MTETTTIACDLPAAPSTTHAAVLVSPAIAALAVQGGARFIDVRSDGFRARTGGLPQAEIVAKDRLAEAFADTSDTRPVVVICGSINGSGPVAEQLVASGFGNVVHVDGGFAAWKDAGLLTTPATDPDA
ncbi:MAG: Rhodanese domain protein [Nocardioidaceae bacterium]|nr:Rhodanese domain protein [Nocardioidaceae bacterium]